MASLEMEGVRNFISDVAQRARVMVLFHRVGRGRQVEVRKNSGLTIRGTYEGFDDVGLKLGMNPPEDRVPRHLKDYLSIPCADVKAYRPV